MDSVRDFAVMLSVSSISIAFITFLVPDGALKRTVSSTVTLFFMCICLVPVFGNNDFDITLNSFNIADFPDEADFRADTEEFYMKSGENVVNSQINECLKNICTGDYSFDIKMEYDSDGNILLKNIEIVITQDDSVRMAKIITSIGSLTGIKPSVEVK